MLGRIFRAITAGVIILLLHLPSKGSPPEKQSISAILWSLDPLGFMAFVPSIICVLLALEVSSIRRSKSSICRAWADRYNCQWGGTTYTWNSGQIIALFVVFGLTLLAFVGIQTWLGETATSKSSDSVK